VSVTGTPYADGVFLLHFSYLWDYPYHPPDVKFCLSVKFITREFHPYIDADTGIIGLDVLKDQWSPALTFESLIFSVQALLSSLPSERWRCNSVGEAPR